MKVKIGCRHKFGHSVLRDRVTGEYQELNPYIDYDAALIQLALCPDLHLMKRTSKSPKSSRGERRAPDAK